MNPPGVKGRADIQGRAMLFSQTELCLYTRVMTETIYLVAMYTYMSLVFPLVLGLFTVLHSSLPICSDQTEIRLDTL